MVVYQTTNLLLRALPPGELALLAPSLERVALPLRHQLERPHRGIDAAYFIESGISSVVAKMSKGRDIEVGLVGRDGMIGVALVHGDTQSPFESFIQMEAVGLRISAENLTAALASSSVLRNLLIGYARALSIQTAYTALANGRCKLEERLARWLLMVHDRMDGDTLELTHEFIAIMLGVRRPGVTVALHELEGDGFIRSLRGHIIIRDRDGLMRLADGTYNLPEREYSRITGIPFGGDQRSALPVL